jgi:hypothetical protein
MASVSGVQGSNVNNLAAIHNQLATAPVSTSGPASGLAFGNLATVPGSAPPVAPTSQGPVSFAGQGAPTEQVVATSTEAPAGGVTLNLVDGSSINVLGTSHIDASLFHK